MFVNQLALSADGEDKLTEESIQVAKERICEALMNRFDEGTLFRKIANGLWEVWIQEKGYTYQTTATARGGQPHRIVRYRRIQHKVCETDDGTLTLQINDKSVAYVCHTPLQALHLTADDMDLVTRMVQGNRVVERDAAEPYCGPRLAVVTPDNSHLFGVAADDVRATHVRGDYATHWKRITGHAHRYLPTGTRLAEWTVGRFLTLDARQVYEIAPQLVLLEFGGKEFCHNLTKGLDQLTPYSTAPVDCVNIVLISSSPHAKSAAQVHELMTNPHPIFSEPTASLNPPLFDSLLLTHNPQQDCCYDSADDLPAIEPMLRSERANYFIIMPECSREEYITEKQEHYAPLFQTLSSTEKPYSIVYKTDLRRSRQSQTVRALFCAMQTQEGGIPWKVAHPIMQEDESVMGIAVRPSRQKQPAGYCVSFNMTPQGSFPSYQIYPKPNQETWKSILRKQLDGELQAGRKVSRLIIHIDKKLNRQEIEQMVRTIGQLECKLTLYLVFSYKCTERSLQFFLQQEGKDYVEMPYSGTCIRFAPNDYYLFSSTKLRNGEPTDPKCHWPLHAQLYKIESGQTVELDEAEQQYLLTQTYQLSRLNTLSGSIGRHPHALDYPKRLNSVWQSDSTQTHTAYTPCVGNR